MLMMNTLTEDKEIKIMADIENIGIDEYLEDAKPLDIEFDF